MMWTWKRRCRRVLQRQNAECRWWLVRLAIATFNACPAPCALCQVAGRCLAMLETRRQTDTDAWLWPALVLNACGPHVR